MNNIQHIINKNINGASFISITTSTSPKLTGGKKNPFQGRVQKITSGANVMVFQNKNTHGYEAMVQRRLEKEGKDVDFSVGPRTWGNRIPNMPFVEHKGQYYLEVIFLSSGKSHYEVDGVITPADRIEGLPTPSEGGSQGGLNDKVIIRTFKISSITSMIVNKEEFIGPFTFA